MCRFGMPSLACLGGKAAVPSCFDEGGVVQLPPQGIQRYGLPATAPCQPPLQRHAARRPPKQQPIHQPDSHVLFPGPYARPEGLVKFRISGILGILKSDPQVHKPSTLVAPQAWRADLGTGAVTGPQRPPPPPHLADVVVALLHTQTCKTQRRLTTTTVLLGQVHWVSDNTTTTAPAVYTFR